MALRLYSRRWGQTFSGGFAGKVMAVFGTLQLRSASWLNAKTRSYTSRRWLVLLVLFCLVVGATCLYLIISSIY